ncbi:uncharacterized protein LOC118197667 [Stegodyphus dumicola]|uniref:uncharacterized protein LOC118197667 n=2 Tax=Stegodyphus dumicola TaxID=202533 RepID=UPI0015ACC6AB|nr:uncharacterized protein LOC118197667 [Stegodyphus dumicola]
MEERKLDKFIFTWIIENASMCHHSNREILKSRSFTLPSLPSMTWRIYLHPRRKTDTNYVAIYLMRTDDFLETSRVKFDFQFLDSDGKLIYSSEEDVSEFTHDTGWGYAKAFKTKTLFRSLINDILIIKCNVEAVLKANKEETLLSLPYRNASFTDVVCTGGAVYKVHKAILSVRWPKLVEKLDAQDASQLVMSITPDVLEAMIEYVYTGKLDCSKPEMLVKLYDAAAKHELSLQCMPVVVQKVRTRLNVQQISFEWPIENFSRLPVETVLYSQVFSVRMNEDAPYRWTLIFHKRDVGFDISICKIHDERVIPFFLKSKISLCGSHSQENEHRLKNINTWKCAEFFEDISTDQSGDKLLLNCQFTFSYCHYINEMMEFSCAFTSSIHCHDFSINIQNLFETGAFSDVDIKVGSKTFSAHKFILCARSPVFSKMFETEMIESKENIVDISDADPDTIDEFLFFLYCGHLRKPLEETSKKLYAVADKYDVPALRKRCSSFFKSNLDCKNISEMLRLADLYLDDDLYEMNFEDELAVEIYSMIGIVARPFYWFVKEDEYIKGSSRKMHLTQCPNFLTKMDYSLTSCCVLMMLFSKYKAILWARWPKLIKELNRKTTQEINFDIPSNVLECMIKYVYAGEAELVGYELFEELSTAAVRYGLPNLSSIPNVSKKCRTRINVMQISFEWPVHNFSNLSVNTILYNVFIVEILKPCRWCLQLHIRENDKKDRIFEICIVRPNDFEAKPIFVKSKISFDVTNCFENDHLFEKDKKWKCAEFSPTISKGSQDVLLLKCEFKFSDCSHSSETLETSCGVLSSIKCNYFSNSLLKLYKSGNFSDVTLVVASKTLSAHKFILCARSSVFSRMFGDENTNSENSKIEITDVDPDAMDEMLEYMYSGRLEKPLDERAIYLYAAAFKYNVFAFKEECSAFLKSSLSAKNVCKVFQLAHSHSDDDLYKSTLKYFSEHAKDIFSTDEWKNITKENLYARGLENLIASKIISKEAKSTNPLHVMEEQTDDKFTFTWIIENFSMCHLPKGQFFDSPSFVIHSIPSIKWCIELYPNGYLNENYLAVYLRRDDDSIGVCNIKYSIQGLDSNEKVIFSCLEKDAAVFETNMSRGYYEASEREPLCQSLINDILIIKCVMEPVFETNEQEMFTPIPYENGLFTDIILRAGDTIYKLHKAILSARWPKLLEKLDDEKSSELALDVKSDVLEVMIEYVYTGKLDCSKTEILADLYAAATKYELLNLQSTPIVALKVRTQFNIKKVSFHWPIRNFSTLTKDTVLYSHVFSVSLPNPCRWYLIFHLREYATANTSFHISICRVRNTEPKPVFVKSKISFDERNSSKNKHFFLNNESWKCTEFSGNISINSQDVLLLKCEFIFSDCKYFSEITESFCSFTTSINCHDFNSDLRNLYETEQFSDARITVGSEVFFVHKCVLCARSSVFSRMLQTKMTEAKNDTIEISDVDPNVMEQMLSFMYSGYLEDMEDSVGELYALADRYDVSSLRKKCSNFFKSNFTFGNVCNILQLADLHSDTDLFNSALAFISDHATDVFSTHDWIKITKRNFMAKLLQDLVLKIK